MLSRENSSLYRTNHKIWFYSIVHRVPLDSTAVLNIRHRIFNMNVHLALFVISAFLSSKDNVERFNIKLQASAVQKLCSIYWGTANRVKSESRFTQFDATILRKDGSYQNEVVIMWSLSASWPYLSMSHRPRIFIQRMHAGAQFTVCPTDLSSNYEDISNLS